MRITALALITTAGLSAGAGAANRPGMSPADQLIVCMPPRTELTVNYAKAEVRKRFAQVGVEIQWRNIESSCPDDALLVSLDGDTPNSFYPGALAYALPYEGRHIHVFYDRVQTTVTPARVRYLLAHVLAHEITHMIEGVVRHSSTGLMKARWDTKDYQQMAWKPLPFTRDDIYLIHDGLARRARKLSQLQKHASDQVKLGTGSPQGGHDPGTLAAH